MYFEHIPNESEYDSNLNQKSLLHHKDNVSLSMEFCDLFFYLEIKAKQSFHFGNQQNYQKAIYILYEEKLPYSNSCNVICCHAIEHQRNQNLKVVKI